MKNKRSNHDVRMRLLFVGYGVLMLYLLFVRGRSIESDLSYWQQIARNYNLIPLDTIRDYWDILVRPKHYIEKWEAASIYKEQVKFAVVNLAGNVVMFIPIGMFLPTIWHNMRRLWKVLLTSAGVIFVIEITQLLSLRGSCDVDDLILNLCGIAVGYVLWQSIHCLR